MRFFLRFPLSAALRVTLFAMAITACSPSPAWGQDLSPRAYVITPLHSNAFTLTYSLYSGNILFDGAAPITNASATVSVPISALYHALNFFGHSANIVAVLPYGIGNFQGNVAGNDTQTHLYRSGLLDSAFRFSVNLKGGPAMRLPEMAKWRQKLLIGASIKVVAPTGQYDPTKLINFGANRWGFKPEVGLSRRWGNWLLDTYGGVWLYTTNHDYYGHNSVYPGTRWQEQSPIGSFEGHLSYDVKPRFWTSLDSNFWVGGQTSINGMQNAKTLQANSRIGGTLSVPVSKRQSLKFSYSHGDYTHYGGDFNNLSVAWQYSWIGWPK